MGGGSLLLFSYAAMRWLGLSGLGVGFLASYALYFLFVGGLVRNRFKLSLSPENLLTLFLAVAAALVVQALPALGLALWRLPVALGFAAAFGLRSLSSLYLVFRARRTAGV